VSSRRKAFTLIELLAAIAIIGILVGILLPAVQQVRSAAQRTQCQNNLKQIAMAAHGYHAVHHFFPSAQYAVTGQSAVSRLLPYLELDDVYQTIDLRAHYDAPSNEAAVGQIIKLFRCPSDVVESPMPSLGGPINYMACKGNGIVWLDDTGPNTGMPVPDGVFTYASQTRLTDIVDGTSNTAFFSERLLADGSNAILSPVSDVFFSPAAPTTPDQAVAICGAVNIHDGANQFPLFMGAPWLNGQHTFQTINPPNGRSCGFFLVLRAVMPPSSGHPGGVNLSMADGSVRWVSNAIALPVWNALGSINGGEDVGNF
jgi:prepilin-type N-terminal cleavage/methylation domain-containing protein/prepilin-type processing-associated H-X9-DG protein